VKRARTPELRICVADDDAGLRQLLQLALEHLGHRVVLCDGGSAALGVVKAGSFDLLFLDLEMEHPGGLEVLSSLQERKIETPAILMSSRFPDEPWTNRSQYANVSLLLKPFSLDILERALQDYRYYPGRTFR
jgi:DNA-binding NtrC family response regulator